MTGFYLTDGAATETTMSGVISDSNDRGLWTEDGSQFTLSSYRGQNNQEEALRIGTNNSSYSAITTINNGQAGGDRAEILVSGDANAISAASVKRSAGSFTDYGLEFVAGATYNRVTGTVDHIGVGVKFESGANYNLVDALFLNYATKVSDAGTGNTVR